jgi:hypothetical protein
MSCIQASGGEWMAYGRRHVHVVCGPSRGPVNGEPRRKCSRSCIVSGEQDVGERHQRGYHMTATNPFVLRSAQTLLYYGAHKPFCTTERTNPFLLRSAQTLMYYRAHRPFGTTERTDPLVLRSATTTSRTATTICTKHVVNRFEI